MRESSSAGVCPVNCSDRSLANRIGKDGDQSANSPEGSVPDLSPNPRIDQALPGRPLRPPRPRRCRPHERGPPRRPHPCLDLGGVDAPYARSRCPRLAPLWRPAAHCRHHPGSGTSWAFLAHLNLAPGPDIPGPAPSPTTPPPPRNPRPAAHRRCPITGSTWPPGPRSAPLPPPLTTAGFRAHHPRKESAPNGAVSRVLRPVHHGIPRPPCRPPPASRRAACR